MLVTKSNVVGIDVSIQRLQTEIYNSLIEKWGLELTPDEYVCYGRCYRNKTKDGYIAENFTGVADKYEEVFFNSKKSAISFFGVSNNIKNNHLLFESDVHLVFMVDIKKLKPLITERADEYIHQDVVKIFGNSIYGFEFKGIDFFIENCLKEYGGSLRDSRMQFVDMHPSHCFRINFSLKYDILQNNC
jgi:hypothetical protein